jgi:hypothetical protein
LRCVLHAVEDASRKALQSSNFVQGREPIKFADPVPARPASNK